MTSGRQRVKPLGKSSPVFLLHGNKLHAHAFVDLATLYECTRPHLSCRDIEQQLNEGSRWRRLRRANVQAPESKVHNARDIFLAGALPGHERPFRRRDTRVAAKVVRLCHSNTAKNHTLFQFRIEGIPFTSIGCFWQQGANSFHEKAGECQVCFSFFPFLSFKGLRPGRSRDRDCSRPPPQIRTGATNASGSHLG
jgi:hypothetical protein